MENAPMASLKYFRKTHAHIKSRAILKEKPGIFDIRILASNSIRGNINTKF